MNIKILPIVLNAVVFFLGIKYFKLLFIWNIAFYNDSIKIGLGTADNKIMKLKVFV